MKTAGTDGSPPRRVVVTGAGGFIGHHLVKRLKRDGCWVRAVDVKRPEFEPSAADEFVLADLRFFENCARIIRDVRDVYHLAADMGGIGYITTNHARLSRNNILINANMLEAARIGAVDRYLYTSSACVYPSFRQNDADVRPLKEADAFPADPEKGYGWEKLFAEQLATYYHEEHALDVRIVRFHNIYGPQGTYEGGREKAPAAICRKVAEAPHDGTIDVWGDGNQTRSFCYIDDCVEGVRRVMESGFNQPLNLGRNELVKVSELVQLACDVAGKRLRPRYDASQPQGVRGRDCDTSLLKSVVGWEPQIPLREGLGRTYSWIWRELERHGRARPPEPGVALVMPIVPPARSN